MENVELIRMAVGVVSVPTIVALIQLFKRIITGLPSQVWLATSFILGVASQMLMAYALDAPVDFLGWLIHIGAGIVSGLAASKAYDEAKAYVERRNGG